MKDVLEQIFQQDKLPISWPLYNVLNKLCDKQMNNYSFIQSLLNEEKKCINYHF